MFSRISYLPIFIIGITIGLIAPFNEISVFSACRFVVWNTFVFLALGLALTGEHRREGFSPHTAFGVSLASILCLYCVQVATTVLFT